MKHTKNYFIITVLIINVMCDTPILEGRGGRGGGMRGAGGRFYGGRGGARGVGHGSRMRGGAGRWRDGTGLGRANRANRRLGAGRGRGSGRVWAGNLSPRAVAPVGVRGTGVDRRGYINQEGRNRLGRDGRNVANRRAFNRGWRNHWNNSFGWWWHGGLWAFSPWLWWGFHWNPWWYTNLAPVVVYSEPIIETAYETTHDVETPTAYITAQKTIPSAEDRLALLESNIEQINEGLARQREAFENLRERIKLLGQELKASVYNKKGNNE